MYAYLLMGFSALFLSLFISDKSKGLLWSFIVITVFLAFRYMWGNDYPTYLKIYYDIKMIGGGLFDFSEVDDYTLIHKEYGWFFLNRLAAKLHVGFFGLVIVLTLFECWTVFRVIRKYVPENYYWVAILVWVFSVSSFCVNASMMRQYLAMCIYLIVIDLMIEKRGRLYLLWSIGLLLFASTIHRSAFVLLLSLPLFFLNVKKTRFTYLGIAFLGVLFVAWRLMGRDILEPIMTRFLEDSEDFSAYLSYLGEEQSGGLSSGLGVIFRYVLLATWLLLLPSFEGKQQAIVMLLILSYFFEVVGDIAPVAGRLALYFSFLSMICWALLLEKAKNNQILYGLFVIEIVLIVRTIPGFFHSPIWVEAFSHYQTILSAPSWM